MKKFLITYLNYLYQECTGFQWSICGEMAEIQFKITHPVTKVISVEEQ